MADQFLPVLITLAVAVVISIGMLAFAALIGQRSRQTTAMKTQTYETGVPLLDSANKRISVKFYLVALVFVVLDVEVAFLYPWAVNYRTLVGEVSTVVLWDMLAFMALLVFAYLYLWRKGVFDWGRRKTFVKPPRPEGEPS
jgi:NADH:ubiquinone oxidoreductase subunit 3 (subunit A)